MMQPDDRQRTIWVAVRQGLLLIVGAIERAYELERSPARGCATLKAKGGVSALQD